MAFGKYGKDRPGGNSGYIEESLRGGKGPSEGMHSMHIDRRNQTILTACAMDNVTLAMDIESSIEEEGGFAGSPENIGHSLKGASAVSEELGAAGHLKHVIIPDH